MFTFAKYRANVRFQIYNTYNSLYHGKLSQISSYIFRSNYVLIVCDSKGVFCGIFFNSIIVWKTEVENNFEDFRDWRMVVRLIGVSQCSNVRKKVLFKKIIHKEC